MLVIGLYSRKATEVGLSWVLVVLTGVTQEAPLPPKTKNKLCPPLMKRALSDWKASTISCSPLLSQSVHFTSCWSSLCLLDGRKGGKVKEAMMIVKAIGFRRRSRHRKG